MTTLSRDELALYVMGEHDDPEAVEDALATDEVARAAVADEARFEVLLRDAAAAATFCPGCGDPTTDARCDGCGAAIAPGGYVVERVLVASAHGRMYVARDADGRQVALKELAFVHSPTLGVIAAFEREAKFLRALDHPAIPRFVASFEEGTGVHVRYYLAQELVTGDALDTRLDDHWYTEAEIIAIARQVLGVLHYLQALTPMVIHRDIKPSNLIRRADGSIAVVDFGAAHIQDTTAGSTSIGTFGYMPIEQLAGLVDATTDTYALGASLIHLLSRREPWRILQGAGLGELRVSRPLGSFLRKLVAPEPRDRFPSASAALEALERVEKGQSIMEKMVERVPWKRTVAIAAAWVATLGAGMTGYALLTDESKDVAMSPPMDPAGLAIWKAIAYREALCACPLGDQACAERARERDKADRAGDPRYTLNPGEKKLLREVVTESMECMRRAMTPPAVMRLQLPVGVLGELWIDGELVNSAPVTTGYEHRVASGKHAVALVTFDGKMCETELTFPQSATTVVECRPTTTSAEPANVPPSAIQRIRGERDILPDDETKQAMAAAGRDKVVGSFKLCVDKTGTVTSVKKLKSTGFEAYDAKIEREMNDWAYMPYAPDGTPIGVCTAITFIYTQK